MDLVRERVRDKEEQIERKAKQVVALQTEKKRVESELIDVQDELQAKERKISSLNKHVSPPDDF
jgi:predicted  nucleic acid-binding Zn-ribbon protein